MTKVFFFFFSTYEYLVLFFFFARTTYCKLPVISLGADAAAHPISLPAVVCF